MLSGKVCQTLAPISAKKSTKRKAPTPKSPEGNELICNKTPA
jgi:hypothetical protein